MFGYPPQKGVSMQSPGAQSIIIPQNNSEIVQQDQLYPVDNQKNMGRQPKQSVISINDKDNKMQNIVSNSSSILDKGSVEIQRKGVISLSEFIEAINLTLAPEQYVPEGNPENLRLSDRIYVFEVSWKNQTWKIRKRIEDFWKLDQEIIRLANYHNISGLRALPEMKITNNLNDNQITQETIFHEELVQYLLTSQHQFRIRESTVFLEFLEISSIDHQGHRKFKECYLDKKAGGRTNQTQFSSCGVFWGQWNRWYLCITCDGVSISKGLDKANSQIREMVMFDYDFSVNYGIQDTGQENGIQLNSSNRQLTLRALSLFQFFDFLYNLKAAIDDSPYLGAHRFGSFSPIRKENTCKWYVDGENYFKDVFLTILKAEKEIFITDWWLSPQLYLLRPIPCKDGAYSTSNNKNSQLSRLDQLLLKKAKEKVKIFIIVFKEPKIALSLDSQYTKSQLNSLHSNITVLRHPSTILPFMWSHHEKLVVVDQRIGFLGGLDLCYGRMDNQNHCLFEQARNDYNSKEVFWPGIDYSNVRVKDFQNVRNYETAEVDCNQIPRMPWQFLQTKKERSQIVIFDVRLVCFAILLFIIGNPQTENKRHDIAMQIIGEGVIDISRHFIQYWNFVLSDLQVLDKNNNQGLLRIKEREEDNKGNHKKNPKNNNEEFNKKGFFKRLSTKFKIDKQDPNHNNISLQTNPVINQGDQINMKNRNDSRDIKRGSFEPKNQTQLFLNQFINENRIKQLFSNPTFEQDQAYEEKKNQYDNQMQKEDEEDEETENDQIGYVETFNPLSNRRKNTTFSTVADRKKRSFVAQPNEAIPEENNNTNQDVIGQNFNHNKISNGEIDSHQSRNTKPNTRFNQFLLKKKISSNQPTLQNSSNFNVGQSKNALTDCNLLKNPPSFHKISNDCKNI